MALPTDRIEREKKTHGVHIIYDFVQLTVSFFCDELEQPRHHYPAVGLSILGSIIAAIPSIESRIGERNTCAVIYCACAIGDLWFCALPPPLFCFPGPAYPEVFHLSTPKTSEVELEAV